jgi:hypothetical protein
MVFNNSQDLNRYAGKARCDIDVVALGGILPQGAERRQGLAILLSQW